MWMPLDPILRASKGAWLARSYAVENRQISREKIPIKRRVVLLSNNAGKESNDIHACVRKIRVHVKRWRHSSRHHGDTIAHNSALLGTPALALQDAFSSRSRHRPQTERPRPANVVIRTPLPSPLFSLPSLNNFPPLSSSRKPAASASELHPAMGSLVAPREALKPLSYPPAPRDESVVDDYHGVLIADPYRWLEDPESEEVKEFVERQARLTDSVLEKCEERERLRRKITALLDHPRYDTPFKRGGKYFYFHNTGLQAQSVLYVQVKFSSISWTKDGKGFFYCRYPAPR
ncbi:hypothetical protein BHM03_00011194 [Ensete ventricosum]|uniref:Peptidase S9A N-terminal domain-containing protein n=1 Tax=Ensete ventricosum TaxID=4639 RepID=A0A445MD87_ENSVE|nr:hypothetical protein BHM03_00011194 [Ensete ventricosum]